MDTGSEAILYQYAVQAYTKSPDISNPDWTAQSSSQDIQCAKIISPLRSASILCHGLEWGQGQSDSSQGGTRSMLGWRIHAWVSMISVYLVTVGKAHLNFGLLCRFWSLLAINLGAFFSYFK